MRNAHTCYLLTVLRYYLLVQIKSQSKFDGNYLINSLTHRFPNCGLNVYGSRKHLKIKNHFIPAFMLILLFCFLIYVCVYIIFSPQRNVN